ncbi:MAG: TRAP transporter large permease [Betaproteobacteria bacterium]|nr:MAG: TRAP transporter large permease [Betaproteobacteria bacterium]
MNLASPFSMCIMAIVALTLLGLPIGHAMIGGSILYLFLAGLDAGTAAEQLSNGMFGGFVLLAIPLFMLAAEFMTTGSITERLVRFCNAFVGRFRGGLALVVVVQNIILSSMSGSALADAAATGKLMQAMMTQDGKYRASFAAALQAVAAVIGPIIPPSIPLVVYSLISDTSVGYLFLGGVVPGLLLGAAQMSLIAYVARRQNFPVERPVPMRELPRITGEAFPALMMPVILLGALYSGITTPTEAAALAALYALLVSAFYYRSLGWSDVYRSLLNTAKISGSIGILIAAAMVFNYVVTIENIPKTLSAMLTASQMSPLAYLMFVNVLLLILGCLLEGTTIILIILPVLLPTATALGIDPVHFGVVAVVNIMIGLVTPPYGLLLFIMVKITKVPLRDIVREAAPFLAVMIATLLLITVVPDLVLWLPRLMGYKG